jgi:hypothetical protein
MLIQWLFFAFRNSKQLSTGYSANCSFATHFVSLLLLLFLFEFYAHSHTLRSSHSGPNSLLQFGDADQTKLDPALQVLRQFERFQNDVFVRSVD